MAKNFIATSYDKWATAGSCNFHLPLATHCYKPWENEEGATVEALKQLNEVLVNGILSHTRTMCAAGFQSTESPIEKLMFGALLTVLLQSAESINIKSRFGEYGVQGIGSASFTIETQAEIGDYRVDFLLSGTDELPDFDNTIKRPGLPDTYGAKACKAHLVIECDGHDFHEKTKDQAKRDKSRDRALIKCGYEVFHYTGSEVWCDVFKCASEAHGRLLDKLWAD